ncbi:TetR/AcrR family transcriptional regulator [Aliiglaciecola litoralis]|uniref:TetR/AcrR family transcriptional regulator n=1 Tax=Aliiglaciecola litoralis TaxID=582857 RepID=A0ABP3WX75_9ALTE
MFQKHGFENVSIAELCATLAVTPTSLYATFGNKESLFLQVLTLYESRFFEQLDKVLSQAENPSQMFRNSMEFALDHFLNVNQRTSCLILLGDTYCRQENVNQQIQNSRSRLVDKIQKRLTALGSESAAELADVLLTLMRGLALSSKTNVDEDQLYTSLEFFCTAFEC